jgi:hypothetical protein
MIRNQMHSVLKNLTENKAPASQINLLSAVQSRIQMSPSIQSKGTIMSKQGNSNSRTLKPAFIVIAILMIVVIFFSVPEGRTLAQEVMHFFTRGETNVMPGPTATPVKWVEQTPGVAAATATPITPKETPIKSDLEAECGTVNDPLCSVDKIRELVDYPVYALPDLPDEMYFAGVTGKSDFVVLIYKSPETYTDSGWLNAHLVIQEEPYTGASNQQNTELAADADIQTVQIGNVMGDYVKGSYNGNQNPPIWDSDANVQTLVWVDHGILFRLYMTGTLPKLSRDDLAALAATLTDGPVGENGVQPVKTPAPTEKPFDIRDVYPLSLIEAEELSGFTLLTPSSLPETLSFVGANYDEKTQIVTFLYKTSGRETVIAIREQLVPKVGVCRLCSFVRGKFVLGSDKDVVSEDVTIETVQIGSLTGQYLVGGWANKTPDISGWAWDSLDYYKRLRFQSNELGVEIDGEGFGWTKDDLVAIAASLK